METHKKKGKKPAACIVGKKQEPRNPVPAFFWAKLGKMLKIRKNTPKVKFFEQFGKVSKYFETFGKLLVTPKKRKRKKVLT